jgi:putative transcriptional regulator
MKKAKRNIGREIIDGLTEIRDALRDGAPLASRFDVRHVEIPEPSKYGAKKVKQTRLKLNASQPVFASLIGVSTILEKAWEQGRRQPSPMARRLLDEINRDPQHWAAMLQTRNAA